jgi:SHS2 domain-containing protein
MEFQKSGYLEVEHTADWELEVWSPEIEGLLEEAARGMYQLAGVVFEDKPRVVRKFNIDIVDPEGQIVAFLSELLFYSEMEMIAFDNFNIKKSDTGISAAVEGAPIKRIEKEIKAVTYHKLEVRQGKRGFEASIIFDV